MFEKKFHYRYVRYDSRETVFYIIKAEERHMRKSNKFI